MEEEQEETPFLLSPDGTGVVLTVNEAKEPEKFGYVQTFNVHLTSTLEGFLHSLEFAGQGDAGRFAYISQWKSPERADAGDAVLYGTERHAEFADGIARTISSELYAGNAELDLFFEKAFDGGFAEITMYSPEDHNEVSGTRYFAVRDMLRHEPGYVTGAFLTHIEDDSKLAEIIVWRDRDSRDASMKRLAENPDYRAWVDGRKDATVDSFFDVTSGNGS